MADRHPPQERSDHRQDSSRFVPHNLEAERALLGSVLLDNSALHLALGDCNTEPGDCFSEAHRLVFQTMVDIAEVGHTIDLVTLSEELSKQGLIEKAGGAGYLAALTDGVPVGTSVAVSEYCRIIKEKSTLRKVLNASNNIISRVLEGTEDPETVLGSAQGQLLDIAQANVRSGFVDFRSAFKKIDFEGMTSHTRPLDGVATGFADVDGIMGCLHDKELIVLAARPSVGKTAWATTVALYAAVQQKVPVGIFSLEMATEQMILRMVCGQAEIDSHRLRSGFASREDWSKITQAVGKLGDAPIYIDDTTPLTVHAMRARARRAKIEHGIRLFIVDYLQLVGGEGENRTQEVSYVSRSLKAMAKELSVPVLALSQLSRATDLRRSPKPQLSDLRESGSIEQDADVVIFLWRIPRKAEDDDEGSPRGILIGNDIAKQRNGPTGDVNLVFIKPWVKFSNLERTAQEERDYKLEASGDTIHVP
jgi:replicative DNA helicase